MRRFLLGFAVAAACISVAARSSAAAPSSAPAYASWSIDAGLPTARWLLASAAGTDGRIYALGGNNGAPLATVEAYDPAQNAWDTALPAMPTARSGLAAATGSDGRTYAIGGWTGAKTVAVVEALDVAKKTWTTVSPMPTRRWGLGAVAGADGRIYTLGGSSDDIVCLASQYPCHALAVVEAYDPATDTWICSVGDSARGCSATSLSPMPTARYFFGAAAATDGRVYVVAGADQGHLIGTLDVYDPAANTWTSSSLPNAVTVASRLAAVAGTDGRIYAIGGTTNCGQTGGCRGIDQVAVYDPRLAAWAPSSPLVPPIAQHRWGLAATARPDGQIDVIGGASDCVGQRCTPVDTVETYTAPYRLTLPFLVFAPQQ